MLIYQHYLEHRPKKWSLLCKYIQKMVQSMVISSVLFRLFTYPHVKWNCHIGRGSSLFFLISKWCKSASHLVTLAFPFISEKTHSFLMSSKCELTLLCSVQSLWRTWSAGTWTVERQISRLRLPSVKSLPLWVLYTHHRALFESFSQNEHSLYAYVPFEVKLIFLTKSIIPVKIHSF